MQLKFSLACVSFCIKHGSTMLSGMLIAIFFLLLGIVVFTFLQKA